MVQILKKIQEQQIKGEKFIIMVPGTCGREGGGVKQRSLANSEFARERYLTPSSLLSI